MSTSPLGLNNYLRPPETLGRQGMLKVGSSLIQTSQLMLPQTVESSDNLFTFSGSFSRSNTPQKPISTINRFIDNDSELESTSEANINPNISETTEEPQTHPSIEENLPNNPLSELHPRLGEQLIQTQSRILTTNSDKIIYSQTPEHSESQSKKNQSDYLPMVQAKWEGDVPQPISEPISVSQRDVLSRKKQPKYSSQTSPKASNNPSPPTVEPQQFIQEKPINSTAESPTVEASQTSSETANEVFSSSEIQPYMIQQQAKDAEDLSSLQSNETETIHQQIDNQSFRNQPSLNPENLTNPNLIQSHSPLIQKSDFIQSQLIGEFNEFIETPQTSEPSTDITSLKTSQMSEPWSNQFDLIDESVPVTDNTPESWSNLTELLNYDNLNSSSNSQLTSDTSQSIKREEKQSIPDSPASVSSSPTKAETVIGEREEPVLIDEEQLEMLARKVYNLLRQQLEIKRESHHFKTDGSLPWPDIISQTNPVKAFEFSSNTSPVAQLQTQTGSTVSLVNYKLQTLTRKVDQLLQLKIETHRERLGFYYRGNKPW